MRFQFDDPVYGVRLFVFVGPVAVVRAWARRRGMTEVLFSDDDDGGIRRMKNPAHLIVWVSRCSNDWYGLALLAHELFHAVYYVLQRAGVNDEEATAYLQGYYLARICSRLFKSKKER